MNPQSRWMVCDVPLIYDTLSMPQFDQMVEHVLSRKSSVACQAVDPPGISDLTDLYNVLCNEVPLANSTDLTMALIVGKAINKHCSIQ